MTSTQFLPKQTELHVWDARIFNPMVKEYAPIGRCIYGPDHRPGPEGFTAEHIVPYSLGGTIELQEASCDDCRDKTSAFEGACAGILLQSARTHFHWRSRKSKKPTTLEVGTSKDSVRKIPVGAHPPVLMLPIFDPPGILSGLPEEHGADGSMCVIGVSQYLSAEAPERWDKLDGSKGVGIRLDTTPFCRMLSKIAHSYMSAELRPDGFDPFLLDIIDGESHHYSRYIGNMPGPRLARVALHELSWKVSSGLIVVSVHLYARFGMCPYLVVAGRMR